uniref:Uncharacterized protein n=1 Tax=Anguilla anguilla TaxID=7936 RepID=A0A0E9WLE3_ANGAN
MWNMQAYKEGKILTIGSILNVPFKLLGGGGPNRIFSCKLHPQKTKRRKMAEMATIKRLLYICAVIWSNTVIRMFKKIH